MKNSWIVIFCSMYALLNVSAAAIIKHKLLTNKINQLQDFVFFLVDPRIVFAIAMIVGSMYFSMKALSISEFSFVIPISTSINFILTILFGIIFFKDNLAIASYAGILLILMGILLLTTTYGR